MDLNLRGQRVLVCGASQGIGCAVAQGFAAEGAHLILAARDQGRLETLSAELQKTYGVPVAFVSADLSSSDGVAHVVDVVSSRWGAVDVLVTNTGGPPSAPFMDLPESAWVAQADNLLMSVVRLVRALIPGMQAQRRGAIVMLTSGAAKEPNRMLVLSNTYRAGLLGLAKTLSQELGPDGIRVNSVLPGYTDTDRLRVLAEARSSRTGESVEAIFDGFRKAAPLGRMASPAEIADVVVYLASERASYVTGVALQVDGGRQAGIL